MKLESGVMFQGLLDIMGFQVQCKLVVAPTKFEIDAAMSVVDIGGGLIVLRKAKNDQENGPKLYVLVSSDGVIITYFFFFFDYKLIITSQ